MPAGSIDAGYRLSPRIAFSRNGVSAVLEVERESNFLRDSPLSTPGKRDICLDERISTVLFALLLKFVVSRETQDYGEFLSG